MLSCIIRASGDRTNSVSLISNFLPAFQQQLFSFFGIVDARKFGHKPLQIAHLRSVGTLTLGAKLEHVVKRH